MKLALYQSPPTNGDEEDAFARLDRALAAAAAAGAGMLVAPELFLPGYNQPELHRGRAEPRGGAWDTRFSAMCRAAGCGLTVGWAERGADGVYNAATSYDHAGTALAHHRKLQLFGPMENAVFRAGDRYTTFSLGRHRCAVMICYDVEFAHHVARLGDTGVDLLLVPTANPRGFEYVSDTLVPARAAENRMTVAYANYCGAEGGLAYGGRSLIAGPDGRPLAAAGTGEVLIVADLDAIDGIDDARLSTQRRDRRKLD